MELNGAERYFTITYEKDGVHMVNTCLDGALFLARNWEGLDRITLNGVELKRIKGDPERYCVYEAERPVQQQPQPTN